MGLLRFSIAEFSGSWGGTVPEGQALQTGYVGTLYNDRQFIDHLNATPAHGAKQPVDGKSFFLAEGFVKHCGEQSIAIGERDATRGGGLGEQVGEGGGEEGNWRHDFYWLNSMYLISRLFLEVLVIPFARAL